MRVVVVGGGVLGATSAYALLRQGVDVTLVDRAWPADGVASSVNAGLISPGHALAWASPAMLRQLPSVLAGRTPQLRVRALTDPRLLRWGLTFLRHCTPASARRSTLLRGALGERSRRALARVVAETGVACPVSRGMLFVHENADHLHRQFAGMRLLREAGHDLRLVSREECLALEPSLARSHLRIAGAVHHPTGLTADCGVFTRALREWCAAEGATVEAGTCVTGFVRRDGRVVAAATRTGEHIDGDAFVVAAGAHSGRLLGPAGRRLRLYPVRGYGLTWHDVPAGEAPILGGIDEAHLVAWSRAGATLRVTGIAEFDRFRDEPHPEDVAQVRQGAERLFPWLAGTDPHVGSGFRPMTPDGLPRVGRLGEANLFVNTGHGNLGWTMACGSADLLAGAVTGEGPPDVLARALAP